MQQECPPAPNQTRRWAFERDPSQTAPHSWPNGQSQPESRRSGTRFLPRPTARAQPLRHSHTDYGREHSELTRRPDNSTRKGGNEPREDSGSITSAGRVRDRRGSCRNPRGGGASRSSEAGGGDEVGGLDGIGWWRRWYPVGVGSTGGRGATVRVGCVFISTRSFSLFGDGTGVERKIRPRGQLSPRFLNVFWTKRMR